MKIHEKSDSNNNWLKSDDRKFKFNKMYFLQWKTDEESLYDTSFEKKVLFKYLPVQ